MSNLIDGRRIAQRVYADLRAQIAELKGKGITPGLAVVLIGNDPASRTYVGAKDKMSRELGLHSLKIELPAETTQSELVRRVEELMPTQRCMGSWCNLRRPSTLMNKSSLGRLTRARM